MPKFSSTQRVLTLVIGTCMAFAAHADVTYRIDAFSAMLSNVPVTGSFVYTAPSFISVSTTVPAASFSSCTLTSPAGETCEASTFIVDLPGYYNLPGTDDYDTIIFGVSGNGGSPFYYFVNGAFGAYGVYDTVLFGSSQAARLTVSVAAVPEPDAAWLLAGGLLALGVGVRLARRA